MKRVLIIGSNGAGKSTTMNMMTGCLAPTSGSVSINGFDIVKEPTLAKKCIGYLPEIPPVYNELTPTEYLSFVAEAKGVSYEKAIRQVQEVMEMTQEQFEWLMSGQTIVPTIRKTKPKSMA